MDDNNVNMSARNFSNNHHMLIRDRQSMEITGVKKIESLNSDEFVVETVLGYMTVSGSDLTMKNFDMEKGDLTISGYVTAVEYYDHQTEQEKEKGFLTKLFK